MNEVVNLARLQEMVRQGDWSEGALRYLIGCKVEAEYLDYKIQLHLDSDAELCGFARDVLGFRNVGGGYIVIGIENKTWRPAGLPGPFNYDKKEIRDKLEKATGLLNLGVEVSSREMTGPWEKPRHFALIHVPSGFGAGLFRWPTFPAKNYGGKDRGIRTGHLYVRCGDETVKVTSQGWERVVTELEQRVATQRAAAAAARPEREPGGYQLPDWSITRNEYVPRGRFERSLTDLLVAKHARDGSRLVTLHGGGGMGKTRIAMEVAKRCAPTFSRGALAVNLEGCERTREAVAEAISAALGWRGDAARPDAFIAALRDQELLLVLDNYEAAAAAAVCALIGELITRTRALCVLVVSQHPVGLSDLEQRVPVDAGMTSAEARSLFRARARMRMPSWDADAAPQSAFESVLELTDGVPLAIELAAGWIDRRSVQEIAESLERTPLGELSAEQPANQREMTRHNSLRRCLEWTTALLDEAIRAGFARLGLFEGDFSAEAALAIGVNRTILDRLQDLALVRRLENNRYGMHRFAAAFATELLGSMDIARPSRQAFVDYFERLAGASTGPAGGVGRLQEWRHMTAAASTALTLGNHRAALQITRGMAEVLEPAGLWAVIVTLSESAEKAARTARQWTVVSHVLRQRGEAYQRMGRWSAAEEAYTEALGVLRLHRPAAFAGQGVLLDKLGGLYKEQEEWPKAERVLRDAAGAKARVKGDRFGRGLDATFSLLGDVYCGMGKPRRAERLLRHAAWRARRVHHALSAAGTLVSLGKVYLQSDPPRLAAAVEAYDESYRLCREEWTNGGQRAAGRPLVGLAHAYREMRNWEKAREALDEAYRVAADLHDVVVQARVLGEIGCLHRDQWEWRKALEAFHAGLKIHRDVGDAKGEAITLDRIGRMYELQGVLPEAMAALSESFAVFSNLGATANAAKVEETMTRVRTALEARNARSTPVDPEAARDPSTSR